MIICSRCKTENNENSKFCCKCGNNLIVNVDAPANEDLKNLASQLNEQAVHTEKRPFSLNRFFSDIHKKTGSIVKKIGKKKLIIIACSLVVVIAGGIFTASYIVPYAPHYFKANKALEDKDFATAISEYEASSKFLDSQQKLITAHYQYAEELFDNGKYAEAAEHYKATENHENSAEKLLSCADKLLEAKEYQKAMEIYELINTDEIKKPKNYASGMINFNDSRYDDAKKAFTAAGEYKDSKVMINACDLMLAEQACKDRRFDEAKQIYASLPADFAYGDISAAARISLLENSAGLIDSMGVWKVSDYYVESRNIHESTGIWNSWYWEPGTGDDLTDQELELSCNMNSNGTFDVEGRAAFYKCDDYSSLSKYCNANKTTTSFTISNITAIPSSYQIDDYTTLNYSGGVFSLKYSMTDEYSAYFYNVYSSSVVYGNRNN